MSEAISLTVNGREVAVSADPTTPLLYVLRNDGGYKGTRHGCVEGHCGACTVLVDGRAATSCSVPLEAAAGRPIETIEAIEENAVGKVLLAAFIEEQAGQCGYCLAGILMRATALLRENGAPDRAAVAAALEGNFCRCGAHDRILNAVLRAAANLRGEVPA